MNHNVTARRNSRKEYSTHLESLVAFRCEHDRHPGKHDDPVLWEWIKGVRDDYKKNILPSYWVAQLNDIGFKWTIKDAEWFDYGRKVKKYLWTYNKVPSFNQQMKMYYWIKDANDRVRNNTLSPDGKAMVEDINDLLQAVRSSCERPHRRSTKARDVRWNKNWQELRKFRKKHIGKWPSQESNNEKERQLARWCKDLQERHGRGMLENEWIDKLKKLGFDFDKVHGKRITLFQSKSI